MCGVLGIIGRSTLREAKEKLLLLTHRGQDASGLLWVENGEVTTSKTIGAPAGLVVGDKVVTQVLGSTRYPTSGKRVGSESDLDTFVGPFTSGEVSLTHNGNITNMSSISKKHFDCDCDFLAERLSAHLEVAEGSLPGAFRALEGEVDGAFSLVGIHGEKMFAYRDSRGFKPLVFGRSAERTVIASESTVLNQAGVPLERDVYPGELLVFSEGGGMESYSVSQNETHSHCFFEYVYFAHPAATIENQLVYDVRFRLGRALANTFTKLGLEHIDYVVPVPDTSRPAAQAMAETLGVPMREIILKNRYLGRTFITRTQEERNAMAKSKYIYLDDKIRGKNIVVVDDSIVRGTTAKMIVRDLRARGASRVFFAATCPPQSHACYYGIDISTDKELIASSSDIDAISEYVGADALIYQEVPNLENAIGLKDLCLACLNGHYPTPHAREIRDRVASHASTGTERDYEREFTS
ncbi:MAG: amidophosphoribosyltransferase [Candidatus Thorarchaeota archaeon]